VSECGGDVVSGGVTLLVLGWRWEQVLRFGAIRSVGLTFVMSSRHVLSFFFWFDWCDCCGWLVRSRLASVGGVVI